MTDSTNLNNCAVEIRASDPNPYHTIIQVAAGANGFTITHALAFIIGGFTIQKDPAEAFQHYYAVDSRPETLVKNCIFPRSTWQGPVELNNALVQNCLFSNNSATYEINDVAPASNGILQIQNCTFYSNTGACIVTETSFPITLTNSIVYNPNGSQLTNVSSSSTVTNCDILGGCSYGKNILNVNPQLTTQGWPTKTSPTIGQGTPVALVGDLFNQTLSTTTPDIGAIQWVDTNGQGLPDWWQLYWWGALGESPTATGPSGLTYAQDYYYGTNPLLASTSGDTITDAQKVADGLNPLLLSNSNSEIPDGIQIANGLNPLLDNSFSDLYGYRYPNIFEYTHTGTLNDQANTPTPDYTVGPTQTYKTISSALAAWYNGGNPSTQNPIFLVQDGTYNEDVQIQNLPENYNVLIISQHGPQKTIIAGDSWTSLIIQGNTVIDGFTITKQAGAHGAAIFTTSDGYEVRPAEINHCVITGCYSSAAPVMDDAPTVFHSCIFRNNVLSLASDTGPQLIQAYNYTELDNCTITDTRTSPSGPLLQAQLFYVRGGNIVVNNSVIYNPGVTELYNFYVYSSNNTLQLNNSFVGTFPAFSQVIYTNCSNQNPQISLEAYPQSSSPVLTWNGPSPLSNDQLDTLLFPRLPGQNIGALGFTTDTTGNGLNAEWETKYFGATGQNASYIGASGLTYLQAYTYGTNPMVFSSSGDSISDYQKILNGFDPWTTDTAGDGVGDATKIKYGMSPTQDDRLGDLAYSGIPNLFQLIDGTNPTIPSQAPGPDIVVDQSGQTTGSYKTITLGLAAANNLTKQAVIIFVKPGNYQENVSIFLSNKVILLKSTQGPYATSIQGTSGSTEMEISTPAVIDGFSFINPQGATTDLTNQSVVNGDGFENPQGLTTGQFPSNAYATTTSTASRLGFALVVNTSAGIPSYPVPLTPVIKNCVFQSLQSTYSIYVNSWPGISLENVIISHCYVSSGPILSAFYGNVALKYCTIYRNTPAAGYQIVGAQNVSVTTSVLYDPGYTEVTVGSGSAIVTNAILYASSATISPSDLTLEPHLLVEGTETPISSSRFIDPSPVGYDINHQPRAGDIGADQWVDSLGKGVPDAWQLEHYGSLTADNGSLSSGGSVLTDAQSFRFGLDPLYPNEFGAPNQNYADPSGDGLTYSQDISLGYNPEIPSNNGAGIINAIQPNVGLSPFNMNINGDGMTNAQNLAAGINPFLPYTPYSPQSTGATVPPTITLLMPVEAVPN